MHAWSRRQEVRQGVSKSRTGAEASGFSFDRCSFRTFVKLCLVFLLFGNVFIFRSLKEYVVVNKGAETKEPSTVNTIDRDLPRNKASVLNATDRGAQATESSVTIYTNEDVPKSNSSSVTDSSTPGTRYSTANGTDSSAPKARYSNTNGTDEDSHDDEKHHPLPKWSAAYARQQLARGEIVRVKWRPLGKGTIDLVRKATEVIVYGLGGVFSSSFGTMLPATRFDTPFDSTTEVKIAKIPGLIDLTLDLHECRVGRKTREGNIVKDGYYNACYLGPGSGQSAFEHHCYTSNRYLEYENRIHNVSEPGYELWSCNDQTVMEQMVRYHVLDYLVWHRDRFYADRTNNLFFLKDDDAGSILQFVSIDHETSKPQVLFRYRSYRKFAWLKMLLDHPMPQALEQELQRVRLSGTKEDFVRNFNASIDGQLDHLTEALIEAWTSEDSNDHLPSEGLERYFQQHPRKTLLTDLLWRRMESVLEFYNLTQAPTVPPEEQHNHTTKVPPVPPTTEEGWRPRLRGKALEKTRLKTPAPPKEHKNQTTTTRAPTKAPIKPKPKVSEDWIYLALKPTNASA